MSRTPPHFLTPQCVRHNDADDVRRETLRRIEVHTLQCLARFVSSAGQGSADQPPTGVKRTRTTSQASPLSHNQLLQCRNELLVLSLVHHMVGRGMTCTQRDLYYHLVRQIPGQEAVNTLLQRLVRVLQVPREALGVVAGARGFVAGTLSFRGTSLDSAGSDGVMIPVSDADLTVSPLHRRTEGVHSPYDSSCSSATTMAPAFTIHPHTRAIVVVEKHAVYHQLCLHGLVRLFPCILVTSQGFPCLSARKLVHALHTSAPHLPVVGLVDFNPAGVSILLQYKLGIGNMPESTFCATPTLRWLGVRCHHLSRDALCKRNSSAAGAAVDDTQRVFDARIAHQPFTARDTAMAANLIKTLQERSAATSSEAVEDDDGDDEGCGAQRDRSDTLNLAPWIAEVTRMAAWRVRVEIEALYTPPPPSSSSQDALSSSQTQGSPRQFVEWLSRELLQRHYV